MFPVWAGPAGDIGADGSRRATSTVVADGLRSESWELHATRRLRFTAAKRETMPHWWTRRRAWPEVQRAPTLPQTDRKGGQEVLRCVSVCVVGHALTHRSALNTTDWATATSTDCSVRRPRCRGRELIIITGGPHASPSGPSQGISISIDARANKSMLVRGSQAPARAKAISHAFLRPSRCRADGQALCGIAMRLRGSPPESRLCCRSSLGGCSNHSRLVFCKRVAKSRLACTLLCGNPIFCAASARPRYRIRISKVTDLCFIEGAAEFARIDWHMKDSSKRCVGRVSSHSHTAPQPQLTMTQEPQNWPP